jgi:NAD(P)-dependent dehydrogenase (short-subunit alcohol dehydrogenase family)
MTDQPNRGHDAAQRTVAPTAVITGAAGGIGEAAAQVLFDNGYSVALWDLNPEAVRDAAKRVDPSGLTTLAVQVDVADPDSVRFALEQTVAWRGTPTAVITGAGIMSVQPFLDLEPSTWTKTLQVNLTGTFLVLQACAKAMVGAGFTGAMVAVSSVAGRGPRADASDYAASKAAVISLVRSAAVALAPQGIRVNAICPGMVDTMMTQRNAQQRAEAEGRNSTEVIESMLTKVPLGRLASVSEVAAVAARLIDQEFSYVTGQAINVCGGLEFD